MEEENTIQYDYLTIVVDSICAIETHMESVGEEIEIMHYGGVSTIPNYVFEETCRKYLDESECGRLDDMVYSFLALCLRTDLKIITFKIPLI